MTVSHVTVVLVLSLPAVSFPGVDQPTSLDANDPDIRTNHLSEIIGFPFGTHVVNFGLSFWYAPPANCF